MFSNVDIGHLCLSLLILTSVIGKIQAGPSQLTDPEGELRQPCKNRRREISFPIVSDASGLVRLDDVKAPPEPRDLLHVRMKWRRQNLELLLFKNEVTVPWTVSEWDSGNVTFARPLRRKCFYQGYIKGQRSSYAALSTCDGLSGYIQTDTELLFIEPGSHNSDATHLQPHLVYTCEEAQRDTAPNVQDPVSTAKHQRRVRRAARSPKYLEVKLVVDYSLWHTIGSKERTEIYVMTLMNIANTVFQHKTLDVDIRVVVTKLIFLEQQQSRLVQTRDRAMDTVNKFCAWSMAQIPAGQEMDYDLAVLITKESIGPSGYAPITGLCNPVRSCAAIVDEGFTTGFVIAHESAHVFGLFHDGHGNHCYGRKYQTSVMAALVESKLNHFWWSECSSTRMKEVINYLYCLNNKPEIPKGHFELEAPQSIQPQLGKPWSLDFQCRREFGQRFKLCGAFYNDPCNVLWCSTSGRGMCRTKRGPPMPGSSCGQHRECRDGRCVYVGEETPVNGNWGAWSSWSDCSTDCGVGVKRRGRVCDNPEPQFDGKPCEGESSEWDTCVDQTCDKMEDGRKGECAVWDSLQIRYGTHKWMPFEGQNASSLCKQTCKSFYTDEVVTIDVDVSDGTPCSYTGNNSNVCIAGECRVAGCDGKLNSTKKRDMCGFCDGDGSQCKIVSGTMTKSVKSNTKYVKILTLPGGARNIKIEKTSKDTTPFLAIEDTYYGKHVLNGDKRQSRTTSLVIHGAMFNYNRQNRTHKEAITSPGPLLRPVEIQFYPNRKSHPVTVDYSYTVHKSDFTLEKSQYKWRFDRWSECSVTCGQGVQTILRKCSDIDTEEKVDDELCRFLKKSRDESVPCHREQCGLHSYNFAMTNEFTECNATCGQSGMELQKYVCERVTTSDKSTEPASMSLCNHLTKPFYPRLCMGPPCEKKEDEKMKKTEAEIEESEEEKKDMKEENMKTQEKKEEIEEEKKKTEETKEEKQEEIAKEKEQGDEDVKEERLITFRWAVVSNWTECSCGKGQSQTREVICEREEVTKEGDNEVKVVEKEDDNKCDDIIHDKPKTTRECEPKPCPPTYRWTESGRYTDCTAGCDEEGSQDALLGCEKQVDLGDGEMVTEMVMSSFCWDLDLPRPKVRSRKCKGEPCRDVYRWQATEAWSECDADCDQDGIQRRELQCQKVRKIRGVDDVTNVTDSMCDDLPGPTAETRPCKGELCPLKWTIEEWSKCSVTCDQGKMYRSVYCGNKDTDLDDIRCTDKPPKTSKVCNNQPCPMTDDANCTDKYSFCKVYRALVFRCTRSTFRKKCCKTCKATLENQGASTRPQNALERYMMRKGLGRWSRTR